MTLTDANNSRKHLDTNHKIAQIKSIQAVNGIENIGSYDYLLTNSIDRDNRLTLPTTIRINRQTTTIPPTLYDQIPAPIHYKTINK